MSNYKRLMALIRCLKHFSWRGHLATPSNNSNGIVNICATTDAELNVENSRVCLMIDFLSYRYQIRHTQATFNVLFRPFHSPALRARAFFHINIQSQPLNTFFFVLFRGFLGFTGDRCKFHISSHGCVIFIWERSTFVLEFNRTRDSISMASAFFVPRDHPNITSQS